MPLDDTGFGAINPTLAYDDATAAIEWLGRAFDFRRRLVIPEEGGRVRHAELSFGRGVIMLCSSRPEQGFIGPRHFEGRSQGLCLHVKDPDAHFRRAKAAGAEILQEPRDEHYGARGYVAKDPEGHVWYFGDYVPGAYWDKD